MGITFSNFKQTFPSTLLQRGYSYFRGGNVGTVVFDEEGTWSAEVYGSETYDVEVTQAGNGSLTFSCTCPYDSEYCKHVAAVLYAIESNFPDQISPEQAKRQRKKQVSRESKLKTALESASRDTLINILLENAKQDRQFANALLLRLGATDVDYSRMVQDALKSARSFDGLIEPHNAQKAAEQLQRIVNTAATLTGDKAVQIYGAILDQLGDLLSEAEDIDGSLDGCLADALEGLRKAGESPTARVAALAYCLKKISNTQTHRRDWAMQLIEIAAGLVTTEEERVKITEVLSRYDEQPKSLLGYYSNYYTGYYAQQIALIQLKMIERLDGEAEARLFRDANLHLPTFRDMAIQSAIKAKDYRTAKMLARTGIGDAKQGIASGLEQHYRGFLLEIAQAENDVETIQREARYLLFNMGRDRDTYYNLLKSSVPAAQWSSFVKELLSDATTQSRYSDLEPWLYAQEEMWDRMLVFAKKNWHYVIEYIPKLEQHYPKEMAALYETHINTMLAEVAGRDVYQRAAGYLQRMKAMGFSERVKEVVADLKTRYPKRRAMFEELDRA
jgi:uncharacterized Zn finger protein